MRRYTSQSPFAASFGKGADDAVRRAYAEQMLDQTGLAGEAVSRGADAAKARVAHQRGEARRSRHPDADRMLDAVSAQSLDPVRDGRGIEAKLRDDRDGEPGLLGRLEPRRPLGDVGTLSVVIRLRNSDRCPAFDWPGLMDHLRGLYLAQFDTRLASRNIFVGLGMLANAEQRWADGYDYVARVLAQQPDHRQALLMQLHFTTALGREAEAGKVKEQLLQMQASGLLNVGERSTLSLYL